MTKRIRPPMQPIVMMDDGIVRFQENKYVRYMLEALGRGAKLDLNDLLYLNFPRSDWEQLMQLIGYPVSGFGDVCRNSSHLERADERAAVVAREHEAKKMLRTMTDEELAKHPSLTNEQVQAALVKAGEDVDACKPKK